MGIGCKKPDESDLLEVLRQGVGCTYLSDLHEVSSAEVLIDVVGGISDEGYSTDVWSHVAGYIMGRPCGGKTVEETKQCLYAHLSQQKRRD